MRPAKLLVLAVIASLGVALLHPRRPPPPGPPAGLPLSAGGWTAARQAGGYRDASAAGGEGFAVVLAPHAAQFQLVLTDPLGRLVPSGATPFRVTFGDNADFAFTGAGAGGVLRAPLPGGDTAAWFRHFAASGSLTVSFDDDPQIVPWVFPLAGAAATLESLAAGMEKDGVKGRPGWTPASLARQIPATPPAEGH